MVEVYRDIVENYCVSCEEFDFFVEKVFEFGVFGVRFMGVGFGGLVIVFVEYGKGEFFGREVVEFYMKVFLWMLEVFVVRFFEGVMVL